jgi:hypothetical protein
MKIEYKSTIDDAVEPHMRLALSSRIVRKWMLYGLIWVPVIFFGFLFFLPDRAIVRIICGSGASLVFIIFWLMRYKKHYANRIRKYVVEQSGTDKSIKCEYELTNEYLIFRKMGAETRFNWDIVKELKENVHDIEIRMEPSGIAIIPHRIFKDQIQREEWINFVKDKIEAI